MEELIKTVEKGETKRGNIEFKSSLDKSIHLVEKKRNSLIGQMRHRILSGNGTAKYVIGVSDEGSINGITKKSFDETLTVLQVLANEIDSNIDEVKKWEVNDKFVGLITIKDDVEAEEEREEQIIVGTAGHVDHGKSTLISCLVSGISDDGKGSMREKLDRLPHEKERGLSADLSYTVYGFSDEGEVINLDRSNSKEKSEVIKNSEKIVSFVDTVGHKPWLRTTIRGIVGQRLDYGLLVVSAQEGVTETTKEHLGILLAMDLPVIISITKSDLVDENKLKEVEKQIEKLLRNIGKSSILGSRYSTEEIVNNIQNSVPIIRTSAVSMKGMDKLNNILYNVPKHNNIDDEKEFLTYIDEKYLVEGVGTVVSGSIKRGKLEKGDKLYIGPDKNGNFKETKAQSIEIHYQSVDKVRSGQIASISISNVENEWIERGMSLVSKKPDRLNISDTFKAEVMVLNHPTSVTNNYEPVIHLETISESAIVKTDQRIVPGEKGEVKFKFKRSPHLIEEGQKFIFREGNAKGIGTIKKVI